MAIPGTHSRRSMKHYSMETKAADGLALLSIVVLTVLFAWRFVKFNIYPYEDAAMLMRYAEHLAQGKGIVWNVGESPVDGATDFLFMVIVAAVHRVGVSIETAVQSITILSHFVTAGLIYIGMRRLQRSGIVAAFLSAAYFSVGPGLLLSAAYFGTPFFALGVAIAWLLAQRIILSGKRSIIDYFIFSVACLTVGLIRPEGVLIGVFILIAIGIVIESREFRRLVIVFGGIFLVFGGAYFVWRWNYFGYPLPNPFYKKGGGHLYFSSLKSSIWNNIELLYPFIPAFLLSARNKNVLKLGIAFSIPIAGSVVMWVLLSDEQNFGERFQYPTLVLAVLSWFPLVRALRDDFALPKFASLTWMQRIFTVSVAVFVMGFIFTKQIFRSASMTYDLAIYSREGVFDVGVMLSRYSDRHYTLATSEAGLLPLYSKWRAIDTWGLNDQWIAHHGLITEGYLARQKPDIIMFYAPFSPLRPLSPERINSKFWQSWTRHVLTLQGYAERNKFTLAAAFGISPDDTHYYYVRSDLPEHGEIVRSIRTMNYAIEGRESTNYAGLEPP